jgi:nucleoside-diphosphate-sugar epimerase
MRLLILGAGGFIGSNLVEFLSRSARADYDMVGVDVSDEKLPAGIPDFTFHHRDFLDPDVLAEIPRADVVIDLVAYANPSVYVESPLQTFQLNFLQNLKIVELCVAHGKRIIQYSTCEVYGRPSGDAYKEDSSELIVGPVSKQRWIYACGKQLLERVIHAYGLEGQLDYGIIRPFNFIGPRFDYLVPAGNIGGPRVFAQFMSALLTGEIVLNELVDIDGEKFYGPGYEDHTRVPADITKLRSLGWEPRHGLRESLRSVMAWYVDHRSEVLASIDA